MWKELSDIPSYRTWVKTNKIDMGWSSDTKYYIEDCNGAKLLLRISDISLCNAKKNEFEIIKRFNTLYFPMSKAIEFGRCNNNKNVYMLLTWVEGTSLDSLLSLLTEKEQYELGIQAGIILKEVHSLEVDEADIPIQDKRGKKMLQLNRYENSAVRIGNDQTAIDFVKQNIDCINPLPPVYEHGDFHVGNLVLTRDKKIGVIDFNRWECGDRYEEFYKVQSFDVEVSIPFSIGQIDGYFERKPTDEFWNVLAVYVAHASLYSIAWAEKFGEEEINGMKRRCLMAFEDYDNFKNIIPRWYINNYIKYR